MRFCEIRFKFIFLSQEARIYLLFSFSEQMVVVEVVVRQVGPNLIDERQAAFVATSCTSSSVPLKM